MADYIIEAFRSLADLEDGAVKVTPKKKTIVSGIITTRNVRESMRDYWVLSDGKNPRRSHVFANIDDLDTVISRLEDNHKSMADGSYWELLHYVDGKPTKVWDTENGRVANEALYGLEPEHDPRKSFYGKAKVHTSSNGVEVLYSYDTPVCMFKDGKATLLRKGDLGWSSSATTLRHVKEFLKQHGLKADNLKQIARDYPEETYAEETESLGESGTDAFERGNAYFYARTGDYVDYDGRKLRIVLDDDGNHKIGYSDTILLRDEGSGETIEVSKEDFIDKAALLKESFLHENETVELNDREAVSEVRDELAQEPEEEEAEVIIDADAETIDMVKDSYLGNAILICTRCRTPHFKAPDDLKKDEENPELFNVGEACPHCGAEDGYELGGQVGKLTTDVEADEVDLEGSEEGSEEPKPVERGPLKPLELEPENESLSDANGIDDAGFSTLVGKYLSEKFSNVESFSVKDATIDCGDMTIDGTVKFSSGKTRDVSFSFSDRRNLRNGRFAMRGANESFAKGNKAFGIVARVKDGTVVFESLTCNYGVVVEGVEKKVIGRYFLER